MKKKHTYFFDIDGTIFMYREFGSYSETNPELTPSAHEKLSEIFESGHTIILTTARPESMRQLTVKELKMSRVPYHQLIMGIPRGARHLINDRSLSKPYDRAIAWNLDRDEGLSGIKVCSGEDEHHA